jgi:hypothetical protein
MNLDDSQRSKLIAVALTSGYGVVLDILEYECKVAETELLQQDPTNNMAVLAKHNRAQAFRLLFERFQKTVQMNLHEETPVTDSITVENYKETLDGNAKARW